MEARESYLYGRDPSIDVRQRPKPTTRINLLSILDDEDGDSGGGSTQSLSTIASNKAEDTASVFLRVRPISDCGRYYQIENNVFKIWNAEATVQKEYTFTDVFGHNVMQREVYNSCVESSIDNDDNLTILMYGTSGSGKTYTLMGDADQPGIIPRAIEHIFSRHGGNISTMPKFKAIGGDYTILADDEIKRALETRKIYFQSNNGSIFSGDKEKIQSEHNFVELQSYNTDVYIWISFLEIYNENVYDLLEIQSAGSVKKRKCLKQRRGVPVTSMAQDIVFKKSKKQRKSGSRRYSVFLNTHSNKTDGDSYVDLILDENFRLKQEVEELRDVIEELRDDNEYLYSQNDDLVKQNTELIKENEINEQKVRNELVDHHMVRLKKKEEAVMARMQTRIDFINQQHASEVEDLKAKIKRKNDEIDKLYEELETYQEAADQSNDDSSNTITID